MLAAPAQPRTGEAAFVEDGWLRLGMPGSASRPVLEVERPAPAGITECATGFRFTADAGFVVFRTLRSGSLSSCSAWTLVADREGRERYRFPMRACLARYDVSPLGRIVVHDVAPDGRPGEKAAPELDQVTDVLLDPVTGQEWRFARPARDTRFTPDLSRYLWYRLRPEGDQLRQSVVVVDVPDGASRTLLGEDELDTLTLPPAGLRPAERTALADLHWVEGLIADPYQTRAPAAAVAGDTAVFLLPRVKGDVLEFLLVAFDLASGKRQDIAGPDQLPRLPAAARTVSDELPGLIGLDPGGKAVLYRTTDTAHRVDIASGEHQVLALRQRLGQAYWQPLQIAPDGRSAYPVSNEVSRLWLEDGRVVIAHHGRIVLRDPSGARPPVTLYPPER